VFFILSSPKKATLTGGFSFEKYEDLPFYTNICYIINMSNITGIIPMRRKRNGKTEIYS
jgi:hypothetical protein